MREDGIGTGGSTRKGRHGIRYERTRSETCLEDIDTEVGGGVGDAAGLWVTLRRCLDRKGCSWQVFGVLLREAFACKRRV